MATAGLDVGRLGTGAADPACHGYGPNPGSLSEPMYPGVPRVMDGSAGTAVVCAVPSPRGMTAPREAP